MEAEGDSYTVVVHREPLQLEEEEGRGKLVWSFSLLEEEEEEEAADDDDDAKAARRRGRAREGRESMHDPHPLFSPSREADKEPPLYPTIVRSLIEAAGRYKRKERKHKLRDYILLRMYLGMYIPT